MKKLIILLFIGVILTSCTQNSRTRQYGGTEDMTLNPNEVLDNMTWKGESGTDLWVLTTDTVTGISYFREHSAWGVLQGQIIVHSPGYSKCKVW